MLGPGAITIGRRPTCDLVMTGTQVSREHARIIIGEQSAAVEDLSSINGVFVNGKRTRGMHRLSPGDRIGVGDEVIEVLGFTEAGIIGDDEGEETMIGRPAASHGLMEEEGEPLPTVVKTPRKP
jgi:pSer/pThr/pTyr-binding forkhead associated (FHA) protein